MYKTFVASGAIAAVGALKVSDADYMQHVARYGRDVQSTAEMAERKARFAERSAFIAEANARSGASFEVAHSAFSDMTEDEIALRFSRVPQENSTQPNQRERELTEGSHPASVDWRNVSGRSYITPVKDQQSCAASWAFATIGAAEARFAIDYASGEMSEAVAGTVDNGLMTFSEQQLLDCDTDLTKCASGEQLTSLGCTGGHVCSAHGYLADSAYLTEDTVYAYTGSDSSTGNMCGYDESSSTYLKLRGYERHTTTDVDAIKSLVAQQPVTTSIAAASPAFQSYSKGIFDDDSCGDGGLDHNVLIVGYGSDATSGNEYWILKNSWGPEWGEAGFMRLRILTEDDGSLTSTVATGGFCNVLQGANYAPSFSDRADHLESSKPKLTAAAVPACAAGRVTWNPTSQTGISFTAGTTTGGTALTSTHTISVAEVTNTNPATTAAQCLEKVTYTMTKTAPTAGLSATVGAAWPSASAASMTVAVSDRALKGAYTMQVKAFYDNAAVTTDLALEFTLTIVDPCEAPIGTVTKGAQTATLTAGTYVTQAVAQTVTLAEATVAFTANSTPSCPFVYVANLVALAGNAASSDVVTFNAGTRTFTFSYAGAEQTKTGAHAVTMTPTGPAGAALASPTVITNAVATYTLTIIPSSCGTTSTLTVTPGPALAAQTYTLGAAAMTITWAAFTVHPAAGTSIACPFTYSVAVVSALSTAVTITTAAATRTLVVETSTGSLVSTTAYSYVISVVGTADSQASTTTQTISLTIAANAACEPPATVTATANTPAAHAFTAGTATNLSVTWLAWTYATAAASSTACGSLGYAAAVPSTISAAMVCTVSTKTCVLTAASVTEAMVGAHTVTITGTTPTGAAIPTKSSVLTILTIASACSTLTTATAPTTAAQTFELDGAAHTYTVPTWVAKAGTTDCASTGLRYVWTIPAALTAYVTTSTTTRVFSITSSVAALATTTAYTITLKATTVAGTALTTGGTATFSLTLQMPTTTTNSDTTSTNQQVVTQISTIVATTAVTAITGVAAAAAAASASAAAASTGGATSFDGAGTSTNGQGSQGTNTFENTSGGDDRRRPSTTSTDGDFTTTTDDSRASNAETTDADTIGGNEDETSEAGRSFDFALDNIDNEYGDLSL